MLRMTSRAIVFSLACLALAPCLLAADAGDDLIEAAQRQDIATVKKLLAEGVDVNSKSRYGATSLFFACDKGNVELVKLLLEKGAEVNVTDTFYKANPLGWTLYSLDKSPAFKEIALLLLDHGAEDVGDVLTFGVRGEDLELVQAALMKGGIEPTTLLSALALAEASDNDEITELLKANAPDEIPAPTYQVDPEKLATYLGDYKNDDIGMQSKVFLDGPDLKLQAVGQEALTLDATGEDTFTVREVSGIDLAFNGRGGLIEGVLVQQEGQEVYFERIAEDTPALAKAPPKLPPIPVAERSDPIQWPRFRGQHASGIGDGQGVPTSWNGESGEGVLWKTRIAGLAHASPIVWGDRIFVTTAISTGGDETLRTGLYGDVDSVEDDSVYSWKVLALDKKTGKILWERVAKEGRPQAKRHLKSTHANPTPATDGRYVVAQFGSEGLYCFDLDGKLLWQKDLGALSSGWFYDATYEWGFSSSPILHDGKVVIQVDIQKDSFIAAYDLATGELAWKTERDEIPTWGTPAVLSGAGEKKIDEIVTNGTTIRGYDLATGAELWKLTPNSEVTVASPVIADGVAFVTGGYPPARPIYAIRPGGRGDLTLPEDESSSAQILWSQSRGGTYIPTPIVYRGLLYVIQNNGRLVAYDAATGEQIYRERVGKAEGHSASPVAADGRLFFTNEEGTTHVVRAGKTFELLGTNDLGEVVMTTPAISDGLLVMRGAQHVYGLAKKPMVDRD